MRILYQPSRDAKSEAAFFERFVSPLGQPRASAEIVEGKRVLVVVNSAKCLSLARVCLLLATGASNVWELTRVEEASSGSWYGDLEPDSVEFSLVRSGPPEAHRVIEIEVPEGTDEAKFVWSPYASGRVALGQDYFDLFANASALVSIARNLAVLASTLYPEGAEIRYEPTRELESGSVAAAIKKGTFKADVPWAHWRPSTEAENPQGRQS
jgi:hypothetical protein